MAGKIRGKMLQPAAVIDIEQTTIRNSNYRWVQNTSEQMQLVFMTLAPGEEIGSEVHPQSTQFLKVEAGRGRAVLDGQTYLLQPGISVFIRAGVQHNIINDSDGPLSLYSIYAPPLHPQGLLQVQKPFSD